jgi:D-cysteine desulfhydrase family pyridoxal phosphate-dependent enzyme
MADPEIWIKRDDFTGSESSGNKLRKLEFLLAEALRQRCDSVITVGGLQSNHCRATAAAAARVGLKSHLILRTHNDVSKDPGFAGNLLISRMVGAQLHLVSRETYESHPEGGWGLCKRLRERLWHERGERAFAFPSGGSNALGVFGYIEAIEELRLQLQSQSMKPFDRIYFACGSGGTAAGLALGMFWSGMMRETDLVAVGVDDTPDIFYSKIDALWASMGVIVPGKTSRDLIRIEDGVGAGYALSTPSELERIARIARTTGVLLDPVYSGKATLGMLRDLEGAESILRVLFIHTGGMLGMYDKIGTLALLPSLRLS